MKNLLTLATCILSIGMSVNSFACEPSTNGEREQFSVGERILTGYYSLEHEMNVIGRTKIVAKRANDNFVLKPTNPMSNTKYLSNQSSDYFYKTEGCLANTENSGIVHSVGSKVFYLKAETRYTTIIKSGEVVGTWAYGNHLIIDPSNSEDETNSVIYDQASINDVFHTDICSNSSNNNGRICTGDTVINLSTGSDVVIMGMRNNYAVVKSENGSITEQYMGYLIGFEDELID